MRVLVLFAHPAFHKSKVNKMLVDGLEDMEGVTFHDLYQEYPELEINVKREQELLLDHDVIMLQFPLFWYSTPAILKEWQDLVLEHGWAFGSKGNNLKDKLFICSITAGGPRKAYQVGDFHNHTLNQLLSPLRQTSVLCKMKPLPPFVVYGSHAIETDELLDSKNDLLKLINLLIKNKISVEEAAKEEYMNEYLSKLD
jgi:glutathione-regulated potassium-efflux system ancillary protein KefG